MSLRARIKAGDLVVGTFVKTPAPHVIEILARSGLDFAVPDQEHAPLDLGAMDLLALAARAAGLPLVARCWGQSAARISPLLDLGCAGVMVPHVADAATAQSVVEAVKFGPRKRGLSPSPRAGDYGTMSAPDYVAASDRDSIVMVQIEDAPALTRLDEIAATPEVDVLFVGPADLSQSLGCAFPSAELDAAILAVVGAARRAGIAAGLFVADEAQIAGWHDRGVSVFVCGSDQSLLLKGARRIAAAARQ